MPPALKSFVQFFTSLRLTVGAAGPLAGAGFHRHHRPGGSRRLGGAAEIFPLVLRDGPPARHRLALPVFPGGYLIGGLLLLNLISAHAYRFRLEWKKSGIWLAHFGLILLLLGELFTGLWQREGMMRLDAGATKNYCESSLKTELAVIDTTNPKFDDVVAIPRAALEKTGDAPASQAALHASGPCSIIPTPRCRCAARCPTPRPRRPTRVSARSSSPSRSRITYKQDEQNTPTAFVELAGPEGRIGTWLVSTLLTEPQSFTLPGPHLGARPAPDALLPAVLDHPAEIFARRLSGHGHPQELFQPDPPALRRTAAWTARC